MAEQGSKWTARHSLIPQNTGHTCCAPGPVSRSGDAVPREPLEQVQGTEAQVGGGRKGSHELHNGLRTVESGRDLRSAGCGGRMCPRGVGQCPTERDPAGAGPLGTESLSCSLVTGKSRPDSWSGEVTSAGHFQLRAVREEEATAFLRTSRPRGMMSRESRGHLGHRGLWQWKTRPRPRPSEGHASFITQGNKTQGLAS